MDEMGQGGAIAKLAKGKLPIPTPQEIIKQKLLELAVEHGWPAVKSAYNAIKQKALGTPKPKPSGGGGALVALAVVALATQKKHRRR